MSYISKNILLMRNQSFLFIIFCYTFLSVAQEKPVAEPLQYPFDEIRTEVSRGVFGDDYRKEVKDA